VNMHSSCRGVVERLSLAGLTLLHVLLLFGGAQANSPYETSSFIGDGVSLDWRQDPVQSWTTVRPVSLWNSSDYDAAACLNISCSGDFDLSNDADAMLCKTVNGTIRISGPLRYPPVCLTKIENGGIVVEDNTQVTSLNGFGRLEEVSGDILLKRNPYLVSLGGLDNLTKVGGSFVVQSCGEALSMTRLDDLVVQERYLQNNLDSCIEDSELHFPRRKAPRQGLSRKVDTLETSVYSEDELIGLRTLHGIGKLTLIGGDFNISVNSELRNFNGTDKLETIGGSLVVQGNLLLQTATGFKALHSIGESFIIDANPELVSLHGLEMLERIGGDWTISQNQMMIEVGPLTSLKTIEGQVLLIRNDQFHSFSRTDDTAVNEIGGNFIIEDNRRFRSLQGIGNLRLVNGSVIIGRVPQLTNLTDGLSSLEQVGGSLYIQGSMITYEGLEKLTFVGGSLVVHSMPSMTSLSGLQGLQYIGEDLLVYVNSVLNSVSDLNSLKYVGGRIRIYQNSLLESVEDLLKALEYVGQYVRITFMRGTVDCPDGTGVLSGELPLIYNTTAENANVSQAANITTEFGNWCTMNCAYPYVVSPPNVARMWKTRNGSMWDSTWGPTCQEPVV